jgi:hypothetical protein
MYARIGWHADGRWMDGCERDKDGWRTGAEMTFLRARGVYNKKVAEAKSRRDHSNFILIEYTVY